MPRQTLPTQRGGARYCAALDPAEIDRIFFPVVGKSADEARAICLRCPVRRPCREYAIRTAQYYGIWGGTTTLERIRIRRERRASKTCPACGTTRPLEDFGVNKGPPATGMAGIPNAAA